MKLFAFGSAIITTLYLYMYHIITHVTLELQPAWEHDQTFQNAEKAIYAKLEEVHPKTNTKEAINVGSHANVYCTVIKQ